MKIVKCGCKYCKTGMRRKWVSEMITHRRRAARHKAKQDLKQGKEPDKTFSIPYTD